ncbi:MAG: TetR family transcriptional regulator [Candidatus Latescibacteria bacterium]|nr:TetR family transcriptional regulator [Candidatus Latescibacterota bacterium]
MPKVSQAHLDSRRDQILSAARSCFNEKGFHRTTMKDIMAASQLSAGAVYNYFNSKEDIIVAMAEKIVGGDAEFSDPPQVELADNSLAGIFTTLFVPVLEDPGQVHAACLNFDLVSEASRNERIAACGPGLMQTSIEPLAALIAQGQEAGAIDKNLNRPLLARILVALYFGLVMQKVIEPDLDIKDLVEILAALDKPGEEPL